MYVYFHTTKEPPPTGPTGRQKISNKIQVHSSLPNYTALAVLLTLFQKWQNIAPTFMHRSTIHS